MSVWFINTKLMPESRKPSDNGLRAPFDQMTVSELERREREGYEKLPASDEDAAMWAAEAAWPDNCLDMQSAGTGRRRGKR